MWSYATFQNVMKLTLLHCQLNEVRKEYQNLNGIVARIDQEANVIEQNAAQVSHTRCDGRC